MRARRRAQAAVLQGAVVVALLAAGCDPATTKPPPRAPQQEARVIVCAPGSYQSGAECLPVKQECPEYTVMQDGQCVLEKAETPPDAKVAVPEPAQDDESILDPRRRTPRSRALLVTELQGLEALYASMVKNAPDRPNLLRRLAEGYVELADAAARDHKSASSPEDAAKAAKIESAARLVAVKYYHVLDTEYPSFCLTVNAADPTKSTGCTDEVLYFAALEQRRSGRLDDTRRTLLSLIQRYPASKYLGPAYFTFGELFRKEAEGDPSKWPLAEQSYVEAAKYPGTPTTRPALLRLAAIYDKQGDPARAKATRAKAQALPK